MTDVDFYFDPVCPFAWMTSKWVRRVTDQRHLAVTWRFISLRLVNRDVDYDTHFPPGYEAGHTAGLRLLRVAAAARATHGDGAVGRLYAAYGAEIFDSDPGRQRLAQQQPRDFLSPILARLELPSELSDALDDSSYDPQIQAETDRALRLTGRDVGTPIIHFSTPRRHRFLRPRDQSITQRRRLDTAVGPRRGPRRLRRVRRAQAQPPRSSPAVGIRRPRPTAGRRTRLAPRAPARRAPTQAGLSPPLTRRNRPAISPNRVSDQRAALDHQLAKRIAGV